MVYHRKFGVNTGIVRIFNTYGPRMRLDDGRVVPNFCGQALRGQSITVYGTGSQTRSFCFVDDLVEELLHERGRMERLIRAGCLVQVSGRSETHPGCREDERALRDWFRRGLVHLLGSDGHSPHRRRPRMAAAYQQILRWAGVAVADRVCSTNGLAVSQGLRLQVLLTHEEIAQMIGTTRETVTRLLSDFKRKKWISMKGASLFVLQPDAMSNSVSI